MNQIAICRLIIEEQKQLVIQEDKISEAIKQFSKLSLSKGIDLDDLKKKLLSIYSVQVDKYKILEAKERRQPWIKEYKIKHKEWPFWDRYKKFLNVDKGYSPKIIQSLDEITDKTLDKLFDPNQSQILIDKKGLVVGEVQSGKTSNYIGLICKAADAGFNLIIVLAGMHNNLRSQTQLRLDEGFLGFDTHYERAYNHNLSTQIGVGNYGEAIANSITTNIEHGDFTKHAAESLGMNFNAKVPLLVVCKKNVTVLKRLFKWLKSHAVDINGDKKVDNKSLLIIDDEADNASINTNKDDNSPTAINKCIRQIISICNRSGYIGYTATPFANIFIPLTKDDLFPRDFIISLPSPNNYIGPDKIFGTSINSIYDEEELLPIVRPIRDYKEFVPDKHKKDDSIPNCLPESLKRAIKCFIITCAIRYARGDKHKHNSMLIHVTRYVRWQEKIRELVYDQFQYYKRGIEQKNSNVIEELKCIYEVDSEDYISYRTTSNNILKSSYRNIDNKMDIFNWSIIKDCLYAVSLKIEVKSINGTSADALNYYDNKKNGISVIAVGGDKLSRGLTLEGLSVSYYLRASKMYDTLMQMGRWFGYKPGYVDLCRLFTSNELNEWFTHITIASQELTDDFNYLTESNSTPEDYALKVRTHPGCLQITALGKMRNTEKIQVSWSGKLKETYQLLIDKKSILNNLFCTDNFLSLLPEPEKLDAIPSNYLWRNISSDLICKFFEEFKLPEHLKSMDLDGICDFIKKLNEKNELTSWSVVLKNKDKEKNSTWTLSNGIKVGCFCRNRSDDTNEGTYLIRKNHIIGSLFDELLDLKGNSNNILDKAYKETIINDPKWKRLFPKPKLVREKYRDPSNPILIIYPLNPIGANIKDSKGKVIKKIFNSTDPSIIGFAIAFPHSETNYSQEYAVNTIIMKDYLESESGGYYKEEDNER
ncbi:MAG: Z1 domain-containing protein [Bacteroidales bacterium]